MLTEKSTALLYYHAMPISYGRRSLLSVGDQFAVGLQSLLSDWCRFGIAVVGRISLLSV